MTICQKGSADAVVLESRCSTQNALRRITKNISPLTALLAERVKGNTSIKAHQKVEFEVKFGLYGFVGLNPVGQLVRTPAGADERRQWGFA